MLAQKVWTVRRYPSYGSVMTMRMARRSFAEYLELSLAVARADRRATAALTRVRLPRYVSEGLSDDELSTRVQRYKMKLLAAGGRQEAWMRLSD